MDRLLTGTLCGLIFALLDVAVMIPLKYENRRKRIEAMSAAFIERFMIGFLIPVTDLGMPRSVTGVMLGLLLSLPSAIVTRAYAPIIGIGAAGGLIIGLIAG